MKIKRMAQRPRANHICEFSAHGDVLTVTVNGESDNFDFTGLTDGTFTDFESSILPVNPLISAKKADGELVVAVSNWYGAEPIQGLGETEEEFAARLAFWDQQRKNYEVEI
ncbi:hypothetical protein [Salinicola sp. CPA57]|uniref:hypothetical protein n=1 Tax=Salinicola sp. CPA57 TaxID=1949080 RepID=UPI000DA10FEE|nr:hypothetical protein [Salinicola sp. CPA57]